MSTGIQNFNMHVHKTYMSTYRRMHVDMHRTCMSKKNRMSIYSPFSWCDRRWGTFFQDTIAWCGSITVVSWNALAHHSVARSWTQHASSSCWIFTTLWSPSSRWGTSARPSPHLFFPSSSILCTDQDRATVFVNRSRQSYRFCKTKTVALSWSVHSMEEEDLWSYVLVSSRRRHVKSDLLQCKKSLVLCLWPCLPPYMSKCPSVIVSYV